MNSISNKSILKEANMASGNFKIELSKELTATKLMAGCMNKNYKHNTCNVAGIESAYDCRLKTIMINDKGKCADLVEIERA
jgi:hypothetical protein